MVTAVSPNWRFLTNQALVLGWIARHPQSTAREIAMALEITERTALKIVGELDAGGYITRRRKGRRNVYKVNPETPLRHHFVSNVPAGELLRVIAPKRARRAAPPAAVKMAGLKRARRTA